MRRLLVFMCAVLLLGVAVAGTFYFFNRTSPRYALHQMVTALMRRNYDKFYSYLDMKSILSSLLQDTGSDLIPPELVPKDNFLGQFGLKIGRRFAGQLVPQLYATFEKEAHNFINQYLAGLTAKDLLALEGAVALAKIDRNNDVAQVTLRYPKDGNLHLTMARNAETQSWQVVAVSYEDLKELLIKNLL